MTNRFASVIEKFVDRKVLVIGEAMLDSYLEGPSTRLCQEAPVPIVNVQSRRDVPGGAANTAINVRALGAESHFLSAAGDDCEGRLLRDILASQGVLTDTMSLDRDQETLAKTRIVSGSHLLLRFDKGTTSRVDERTEHALLEGLIALHRQCDAIVVSDYNYGILTPRLIRCLRHLQHRDPKVLVVDSKRLADYRAAQVTAVKPNFGEALSLLNIAAATVGDDRAQLMAEQCERLLEATGARIVAVTMDVDGAWFFERGQSAYRTYARPYPQSQAAGAGDTFLAALALSLSCGADTQTAAEIASAAAAVVVAKDGTAVCANDELEDGLCTPEKIVSSRGRLAARSSLYRHHGKRVVLTCGCFDILHPGHVAYLNQAKALGDILIVAVNSDQSVRRLKGPSRPINRAEDRVQVLAALSSIDHLIVFDETTPSQLIEAIRPDVFVKGGDYTRASLPEAATVERLGGEVRIVPFVADRSTTHLIQRIRKLDSAPVRRASRALPENIDEERQMDGGAPHFVY